MSTDRELLELAAKAAGLDAWWCEPFGYVLLRSEGNRAWRPLDDDGDALRLAVKLNMCVSIHDQNCMACAQTGTIQTIDGIPTEEATRRAIVRAAAEIGRSMK